MYKFRVVMGFQVIQFVLSGSGCFVFHISPIAGKFQIFRYSHTYSNYCAIITYRSSTIYKYVAYYFGYVSHWINKRLLMRMVSMVSHFLPINCLFSAETADRCQSIPSISLRSIRFGFTPAPRTTHPLLQIANKINVFNTIRYHQSELHSFVPQIENLSKRFRFTKSQKSTKYENDACKRRWEIPLNIQHRQRILCRSNRISILIFKLLWKNI